MDIIVRLSTDTNKVNFESRLMKHAFFFIFFFVLYVEPAYSYLDPGAGSMLAQLIMGGVAGVLVVIKLYWNKVKSFFIKPDSNSEMNDTSQKE